MPVIYLISTLEFQGRNAKSWRILAYPVNEAIERVDLSGGWQIGVVSEFTHIMLKRTSFFLRCHQCSP
jgi:hypothetical protein